MSMYSRRNVSKFVTMICLFVASSMLRNVSLSRICSACLRRIRLAYSADILLARLAQSSLALLAHSSGLPSGMFPIHFSHHSSQLLGPSSCSRGRAASRCAPSAAPASGPPAAAAAPARGSPSPVAPFVRLIKEARPAPLINSRLRCRGRSAHGASTGGMIMIGSRRHEDKGPDIAGPHARCTFGPLKGAPGGAGRATAREDSIDRAAKAARRRACRPEQAPGRVAHGSGPACAPRGLCRCRRGHGKGAEKRSRGLPVRRLPPAARYAAAARAAPPAARIAARTFRACALDPADRASSPPPTPAGAAPGCTRRRRGRRQAAPRRHAAGGARHANRGDCAGRLRAHQGARPRATAARGRGTRGGHGGADRPRRRGVASSAGAGATRPRPWSRCDRPRLSRVSRRRRPLSPRGSRPE